jgi:hypothetical protein
MQQYDNRTFMSPWLEPKILNFWNSRFFFHHSVRLVRALEEEVLSNYLAFMHVRYNQARSLRETLTLRTVSRLVQRYTQDPIISSQSMDIGYDNTV